MTRILALLLLMMPVSLHGIHHHCPRSDNASLLIAATTSFENSGLRQRIEDAFEQDTAIDISFLIAGSGQSLRIAARGDSDGVISHHPSAEQQLLEQGAFAFRQFIMMNHFLLIAPQDDPCATATSSSMSEALQRLASCGVFLSRGDQSGTHHREQMLWQEAGITQHTQEHYLTSGQGMGATLTMANEINAYTISDSATWHRFEPQHLRIAMTDSVPNQYSILITHPVRHPHVRYEQALCFAHWLRSEKGRQTIGSLQKNGKPLFFFPQKRTAKTPR